MDHKRVALRLVKLLTVRIRAFAVDFRVRPNARVYVALGIFGWPPQGNISSACPRHREYVAD